MNPRWKLILPCLYVFSVGTMFLPAEAAGRFAALRTIEVKNLKVAINGKDAQTAILILETVNPESIDSVEVAINNGAGDSGLVDGYFKWDKVYGFGKVDGNGSTYIDLIADQCRYEIKGNSLVLIFKWTFHPLHGKFSDNHIIWRVSQFGKAMSDWEGSSAKFATIADTQPPAAPLGLVAVHNEMGLFLYWDISLEKDVVGYNVYRSSNKDGPFNKINTEALKWPNYKDEEAVTTPAYYSLTALDVESNESKLSRYCQVL